MNNNFQIIKSILFKSILSVLLIVVAYLFCAFSLPQISVNGQTISGKENQIAIYVLSNGVHTDIALPSNNDTKNWETTFCRDTFMVPDSSLNYIAFGWGDKGFYLNTPEWSDLKISTAFNAAFGLGGTAMHVRYLKEPQNLNKNKIKLTISISQYKKLIEYIEESFCKNDCDVAKINHPGYGENDLFYEANGKYSIFKTCNVWTSKALKHCGVKTGLWTPFAAGLMSSLSQEK